MVQQSNSGIIMITKNAFFFFILIISEATSTPEQKNLEWEKRQTEAGK